jgi:hypothetical protein
MVLTESTGCGVVIGEILMQKRENSSSHELYKD